MQIASLEVENKLDGVSGSNKICYLQPYEVLQVIEQEKNSGEPMPEKPKKDDASSIIDWLIKLLQWVKKGLPK